MKVWKWKWFGSGLYLFLDEKVLFNDATAVLTTALLEMVWQLKQYGCELYLSFDEKYFSIVWQLYLKHNDNINTLAFIYIYMLIIKLQWFDRCAYDGVTMEILLL